MLHIFFKLPTGTSLFERMDAGDVAVFLEDSVLKLLKNGFLADALTRQLANNRLCALADDLITRGITPEELVNGIEVIDYAQWVELTVAHRLIHSWVQ